ncbi:MAG: hypothetical protein QM739_02525 [Propionivibrio sp.]
MSGGLLGQGWFARQAVILAMAGQHGVRGGFELVGLPGEISTGAAPGLGGIARQLDAIDREHLPADQALTVTEVEYVSKEPGYIVSQARDESGQCREVRGAVAREGDEGDVFAAQALDTPAADDAFGVGAEDDLEQHSRWVGRSTRLIVAVAGVKTGKVEIVIKKVMHGVGEAAG